MSLLANATRNGVRCVAALNRMSLTVERMSLHHAERGIVPSNKIPIKSYVGKVEFFFVAVMNPAVIRHKTSSSYRSPRPLSFGRKEEFLTEYDLPHSRFVTAVSISANHSTATVKAHHG